MKYIYVVTINICYEDKNKFRLLATLSHGFTKKSNANNWGLFQLERDDKTELLKEALDEFYQDTDKFLYIQDLEIIKVEID